MSLKEAEASNGIVTVVGSFVVLYVGKVLVANLPTTLTVALHWWSGPSSKWTFVEADLHRVLLVEYNKLVET